MLKKRTFWEEIRSHGDPILQSEAFHRATMETHHIHGTVSDHTLTVCAVSVRMARLLKKAGLSVNEKDLINASLCHDLGMIGREEKFKSRKIAWKAHPEESIKVAKELVPDLSPNAEDMIRTHMWPVSGPHPHSREARILNIADKIASVADWKNYFTSSLSRR